MINHERDVTPSHHEPWCDIHQGDACTCNDTVLDDAQKTFEMASELSRLERERELTGLPKRVRYNGKWLTPQEMLYLRAALNTGESLMKPPKGAYAQMINRARRKVAAGERLSKNDVNSLCEACSIELLASPRSSHRYGAMRMLAKAHGVFSEEPKPKKDRPEPQPQEEPEPEPVDDLRDDLPV